MRYPSTVEEDIAGDLTTRSPKNLSELVRMNSTRSDMIGDGVDGLD